MKRYKIAIIGAGAVGSTTAYALILHNITADIRLIDIDEVRCRGEILDLSDALPFSNVPQIESGTSEYARNADIIIIAAGARQKPGQKRTELVETNKKVISSIMQQITPLQKEAIIIMATNPVDVLTLHAQNLAGLPRNQVFGSGTFLDTQRLRGILAHKLNIAEQSIHAYILGEHGVTQFPAWSCAYIGGIPITDFKLDKKELDLISVQTRDKVQEIIAGKQAAYYGIATCVAAICRTIINNQRRVTPLSVFIEQFGVSLSLPTVLGERGVEQILEQPLDKEEQEKLAYSAEQLRQLI